MHLRSIPPLPGKPPKKKRAAAKLIWLLSILCIVLLVVLFFRSPISKVTEVRWIGEHFVTKDELGEVSGLKPGEPFFGTSEATISARIQEKFPYVKSVKMVKHFPGVVEVYVHEYAAVAYELSADGQVLACLENGTVVKPSAQLKTVLEKPVLTKWDGQAEVRGLLSQQLAKIPKGLLADISEISFYPSSSYPDRIKMYTRSGFEVVTTVSALPDKITYLSGVVETQEPGRITMLKADSYIPYSSLPEDPGEIDAEEEQTATNEQQMENNENNMQDEQDQQNVDEEKNSTQ
ncbi:FtsQ-type POTRA domain-containing protein [Paenibacillus thiaminolyticus]|uniref:cell division protein FtsQ/DivIB n=1 Tax=Paenibacillus TaxID=44249 RepID=UPI001059D165|nr:FtsQ-type POTRA domain-containing protein [Paenibacillus dendritiformis]TDL55702.1 FtsQ-type POTRA domain-containing protein [Paenibacillus dendritiformis]